jgi:valyl-tRNA synthetase
VVAREAPTACKCGSEKFEQETDVLDTWFSSGLLPFTTLGWPAATRDLDVFYPNSLMITGFDILFFWVARMIMLGCWFMMPPHKPESKGRLGGEEEELRASVPFREVYIHALVRDADRQKMSKTKGNVLDPIEVIGQYGTDATRFTLAAMAAPGTDIAFSESRTAGYRNFANKIWNAARFLFMNVDRIDAGLRPVGVGAGELVAQRSGIAGFEAKTLEDRWILSRFNRAAQDVNESLQTYRFDEAATRIYDFFWGDLCDWYLELIKPRLNFEEGADRGPAKIACANLVNLFEASLRLLHPVMPFITEEVWHAMHDGKPPLKSIALAPYPAVDTKQIDLGTETEMAILQDLIVSVRNLRAELKVEPKVKIPIEVFASQPEIRTMLEKNSSAVLLDRPANVEKITFVNSSLSKLAGTRSTSRFDVHAIYEKKIDVAAERERLKKELEKIEKQLAGAQARLVDEQFLRKAPAHVVEGLRKQVVEQTILRNKIVAQLKELE